MKGCTQENKKAPVRLNFNADAGNGSVQYYI
jgi:hypothetical protein